MAGDGADAQLGRCPAELSNLRLTLQLVLDALRQLGIDLEDAVSVMVEVEGNVVTAEQLPEQQAVTASLLLAEQGCCYVACGVVDSAQKRTGWLVWAKPVMQAAIHLQQHACLGHSSPRWRCLGGRQ